MHSPRVILLFFIGFFLWSCVRMSSSLSLSLFFFCCRKDVSGGVVLYALVSWKNSIFKALIAYNLWWWFRSKFATWHLFLALRDKAKPLEKTKIGKKLDLNSCLLSLHRNMSGTCFRPPPPLQMPSNITVFLPPHV
jgi:hypothetical protein